ncbi:OLC1v1033916C1 [Oldenlandia corymbosa var. corymbosa]|uniref:OLC1v1033916C1 n=1 Tax=Oldenlandia corymbosa var. corymbosa TaxID=529605 RepID=A0AAV1CSB1_OLDCO|nr:OLC1v1033916C1 [Oldenlandia corymbosa var. corymbosa]
MEPLLMDIDWSSLNSKVVVEIAKRLRSLEDFMAFREVCTFWRAAVDKFAPSSCPRVPLLMLAEGKSSCDDDEREFYSLSKKRTCMRLHLPEAKGKRCFEVRFGWLLTLTNSGETTLLNPFSNARMELPNFHTLPKYNYITVPFCFTIDKGVLSDNPSRTSNFILMAIQNGSFLAFCRPGDRTWTRINSGRAGFLHVNYYKGSFYAINFHGDIWVWDCNRPIEYARILFSIDERLIRFRQPYLVESSSINNNGSDDLLLITRYTHLDEDDDCHETMDFKIFRLNLMRRKLEKIFSLGGEGIFVGDNAAISIPSTQMKIDGIQGNCIYFTDDCWELYRKFVWGGRDAGRGGGHDMGVFDIEDETTTLSWC